MERNAVLFVMSCLFLLLSLYLSHNNNNENHREDYEDLVGYKKIGIHEVMLGDHPRMKAYRDALAAPELIKDKVVMDIGAGTGILSLWAARNGARKVVSIEYHARLASSFASVVAANGLGKIIEVHSGAIENIDLTYYRGKVDVIVSEWMGYALLYENMLESVLYARDNFLKPDGVMMPSEANLYVVGATDVVNYSNKKHLFENVYGFDMRAYTEWTFREPSIAAAIPGNIVTAPTRLLHLDLRTVRVEDSYAFEKEFDLYLQAADKPAGERNEYDPLYTEFSASANKKHTTLHLLTLFFDVKFTNPHQPKAEPVVLATSPFHPETHWYQTHLFLREPLKLAGVRSGKRTIHAKLFWKRLKKREVAIELNVHRTETDKWSKDSYAIEY
eukprot:comp16105_c0_seq1/m.25361 comp16105_c0_seq1/g.25361  ORF comp16105_c0_seq1/g.25361 comp16105_c0_seq1/m.25361 type:complete len:388 (-) comp16105_c0_seq1:38-1201(-)